RDRAARLGGMVLRALGVLTRLRCIDAPAAERFDDRASARPVRRGGTTPAAVLPGLHTVSHADTWIPLRLLRYARSEVRRALGRVHRSLVRAHHSRGRHGCGAAA